MITEGRIIDADADSLQRIRLNARHGGVIRPVIIAEEIIPRSPHPDLDPIVRRLEFENELIEKLCDMCPDSPDCVVAGDTVAPERCKKLRDVMRG